MSVLFLYVPIKTLHLFIHLVYHFLFALICCYFKIIVNMSNFEVSQNGIIVETG